MYPKSGEAEGMGKNRAACQGSERVDEGCCIDGEASPKETGKKRKSRSKRGGGKTKLTARDTDIICIDD